MMSETREVAPMERIRIGLERLVPEIAAVLPAHITPERFKRVCLTAVQSDPDLLQCDARSLFEAALRCATDGLIPDKREAAFVSYNVNVAPRGERAQWAKKAQYMPMVKGLVKLIRQSGDVAMLTTQIVHENDEFDLDLASGQPPVHRPPRDMVRGASQFAYACVTFKDGTSQTEVMDRPTMERIRATAKSDKVWGPWEDEMWRKSVLRRLTKILNLSPENNQVIDRDNDLYDLEAARQAPAPRPVPKLDTSFPTKKAAALPAPAVEEVEEVEETSGQYTNNDEVIEVEESTGTHVDPLPEQAEVQPEPAKPALMSPEAFAAAVAEDVKNCAKLVMSALVLNKALAAKPDAVRAVMTTVCEAVADHEDGIKDGTCREDRVEDGMWAALRLAARAKTAVAIDDVRTAMLDQNWWKSLHLNNKNLARAIMKALAETLVEGEG